MIQLEPHLTSGRAEENTLAAGSATGEATAPLLLAFGEAVSYSNRGFLAQQGPWDHPVCPHHQDEGILASRPQGCSRRDVQSWASLQLREPRLSKRRDLTVTGDSSSDPGGSTRVSRDLSVWRLKSVWEEM